MSTKYTRSILRRKCKFKRAEHGGNHASPVGTKGNGGQNARRDSRLIGDVQK